MAESPDYSSYPPRLTQVIESGTFFVCNEIIEPTGANVNTYICKENYLDVWYFVRIEDNDNFTHATKKNNPTVDTYDDAKTNYETLVYGTYKEAF